MSSDAVTPSRKFRNGFIASVPVLLLATWYFASTNVHDQLSRPTESKPIATVIDGALVYQQHCAYCHGSRGDGNGVAGLNPKARYFGRDKYKFASTKNAVPTDDDLLRVIRHGIPGSAMPNFDQLSAVEQSALVSHLRVLTKAGLRERFRLEAEKNEEDPDWRSIAGRVEKLTEIGDSLTIPIQFAAATPESIAHGREVYVKSCISCHGPTGRGDGPQVKDLKNDTPDKGGDGQPNRPRDLTAGLFKGGREKERLYARLMLGIPGTPMPANNALPTKDIDDLLNYVLSLSEQPQSSMAGR
jgi:mono/diheme cytochrome c family protein